MEHGDNEGFPPESGFEGSIITARGTGDGLVIRLDGRAEPASIRSAFSDFLASRRRFVSGNDVSFEWVGVLPDAAFIEELSEVARSQFDIEVKSSSLREGKAKTPKGIEPGGLRDDIKVEITGSRSGGSRSKLRPSDDLGLFGGVGALPFEEEVKRSLKGVESRGAVDPYLWDNADARVIFSTIRSGQKIETEHSLVIVGEVNSGAELIAGGDIFVLGTLRGVAHAGAYDETGGGRVIFALNLQATQLRIGMVISRGSASDTQRGPEIARVDGTTIVVEPYVAKTTLSRRRD